MTHRLYVPQASADRSVTLEPDQSHYLTRVLRLQADARVECFDGRGAAFAGVLADAHHKHATIHIGACLQQQDAPAAELHLALALLKGEAMDRALQKACELGVTRITPLTSVRTNVKLSVERQAKRQQHWQRIIEATATQCGQNHLPQLCAITPLAGLLHQAPGNTVLALQPGAAAFAPPATGAITLLVGPEGGWDDAELAMMTAADVQLQGLGELVLRAETAPLAALAVIRHSRNWR